MSPLVESIKVWNGKLCHIQYHEARAHRACQLLFGIHSPLQLQKEVIVPTDHSKGLAKCRIVYDEKIRDITFSDYKVRKINTLKIVHTSGLIYDHKLLDRLNLDCLWQLRGPHDEIIIINDGNVTDAYYYNLVFERQKEYVTPNIPLLKGVRRQILLDQHKIVPANIREEDIHKYEKIHLVNALTPLGAIVLDVDKIY